MKSGNRDTIKPNKRQEEVTDLGLLTMFLAMETSGPVQLLLRCKRSLTEN
jgi:hypothetical protein